MTNAEKPDIMYAMKKLEKITSLALCACIAAVAAGCGRPVADRKVNDPDSGVVAKLTLYATGERGKVAPMLVAAGHAYCSVENVSDAPIALGHGYVLPEGATVTLASWEFDAHGGIWYNIEPTYIDQGWFGKRKSITRNVDSDALSLMNEYLRDPDTDKWTLFANCTHFAVGLWNAASADSGDVIDTKGMLTPSDLVKHIVRFEGNEVGRPHNSAQPIGYYSGKEFIEFKLTEKK